MMDTCYQDVFICKIQELALAVVHVILLRKPRYAIRIINTLWQRCNLVILLSTDRSPYQPRIKYT